RGPTAGFFDQNRTPIRSGARTASANRRNGGRGTTAGRTGKTRRPRRSRGPTGKGVERQSALNEKRRFQSRKAKVICCRTNVARFAEACYESRSEERRVGKECRSRWWRDA